MVKRGDPNLCVVLYIVTPPLTAINYTEPAGGLDNTLAIKVFEKVV